MHSPTLAGRCSQSRVDLRRVEVRREGMELHQGKHSQGHQTTGQVLARQTTDEDLLTKVRIDLLIEQGQTFQGDQAIVLSELRLEGLS